MKSYKNLDKKITVNGLTNCKRHDRGVHYKTTRAVAITFLLWANNVDRVRRDIYITVRVIWCIPRECRATDRVKGRRNCWTYFPRWWRLMKEKIIRKIEKACRRPRTSVKGRVCHSSGVSREREKSPRQETSITSSRLYRTEIRIRIFPFGGEVFVWDKSIASLELYSKEEIISISFSRCMNFGKSNFRIKDCA